MEGECLDCEVKRAERDTCVVFKTELSKNTGMINAKQTFFGRVQRGDVDYC